MYVKYVTAAWSVSIIILVCCGHMKKCPSQLPSQSLSLFCHVSSITKALRAGTITTTPVMCDRPSKMANYLPSNLYFKITGGHKDGHGYHSFHASTLLKPLPWLYQNKAITHEAITITMTLLWYLWYSGIYGKHIHAPHSRNPVKFGDLSSSVTLRPKSHICKIVHDEM